MLSGQGYGIDFVLADTPGNMDRISLRRISNAEFVLLRIHDCLCGMVFVVGEKLGWSRVFRYI